MKRALDICVAGLCLLLFLPILLFFACAINITMGNPVFFRQQRPGFKGKPFFLAKFRTMRTPRSGEESAEFDLKRITGLGRFLRSSSIDELPTLWNVLRGDMSLVGPRPLLMRYIDRYTSEQARRHEVKPGVTGWAQINGRNAITWEEKFSLDVWYVDNRSLWLDLRILFITVAKVLKKEGISHGDDATMPEFMGTEK